jgi:hypothetical protein
VPASEKCRSAAAAGRTAASASIARARGVRDCCARRTQSCGEHRDDGALAERLRAVIRERAIPFDACGEACLCHFDFHSGNVLAER